VVRIRQRLTVKNVLVFYLILTPAESLAANIPKIPESTKGPREKHRARTDFSTFSIPRRSSLLPGMQWRISSNRDQAGRRHYGCDNLVSQRDHARRVENLKGICTKARFQSALLSALRDRASFSLDGGRRERRVSARIKTIEASDNTRSARLDDKSSPVIVAIPRRGVPLRAALDKARVTKPSLRVLACDDVRNLRIEESDESRIEIPIGTREARRSGSREDTPLAIVAIVGDREKGNVETEASSKAKIFRLLFAELQSQSSTK